MKSKSYREILIGAIHTLEVAGVPEPTYDARALLYEAFHLSPKDYFLRMNEEADLTSLEAFESLIAQRRSRKPLQQILGRTGFMGLDFKVNEHVLCPRQDTELLVEKAAEKLSAGMTVLDLCTGSGCVLISLLHLCRETTGIGVDISGEAIALAKENAKRNLVHPQWRVGNLFEPVEGRSFDVIVSNPPYIPSDIIDELMPEVKDYEPRTALDGGADGLAFYRRIVEEAPKYLNDDGRLFMEIGVDEGRAVESLLFDRGFYDIFCFKDYADNDRVVCGRI